MTPTENRPVVIAHRTCPRDAPENSLAGIAKAQELGADVVEIDVRRTADGVPVLLHDKWLLRTTRWPLRVDWVPARRVTRTALRGGGTVPSLAEAFAALGPTMGVAIDVKDPGAADAVLAEVRNQRLEQRTRFWSQHERAVRFAAARAPEVEPALLRDTETPDEMARFLADAGDFGARAISAHWSQVSTELADRCRQAGISLYAWWQREQIDPGVLGLLDGVVTDWPASARRTVDSLPS